VSNRCALQEQGCGESVLVIDDEPHVRMLMCDALRERGYRVSEAQDGASGLQVLRAMDEVDLMVTDVGLPGGMDGRQVADAARAMRPALRVLFVTGYAENAAVDGDQLETGMAVLLKPFGINNFTHKVAEILGPALFLQGASVRHRLRFAAITRQVQRDGGAGARGGTRPDGAAGLVHEPVDHRQAKAGALTDGFGGEERIENPVENFRGDAGARVGHADFDVVTLGQLRLYSGCVRAGDVARAHGQFTAARHGIARVEGQVYQRAFQLGCVNFAEPQVAAGEGLRADGRADGGGDQLAHARHQPVDVGRFGVQRLTSRERQQPLGEQRCAGGRIVGGIDVAIQSVHPAVGDAPLDHFQAAEDAGEQVVEVVSDAAGNCARASDRRAGRSGGEQVEVVVGDVMEIRTECSAGHLTAGVGHGLHQAFKVEIDGQLGVDPVQCLQRARFFSQRRFAGFKGCAGQVRVGDVVAFTEDPGDLACGVKQGLIDEIQVTDFGRGIGMAQLDRRALVHQALARVVHRIEPLIKALATQLRECLIDGLADVIALAEQTGVGLIDELKAVFGAIENGDETRCLLEHFALAHQFFGLAPLGQHPLGDLMALIENAGDQAVLPTDRREAVVPPGDGPGLARESSAPGRTADARPPVLGLPRAVIRQAPDGLNARKLWPQAIMLVTGRQFASKRERYHAEEHRAVKDGPGMPPTVATRHKIQRDHGEAARSMAARPATARACLMQQREILEPFLFRHSPAIQRRLHRAVNAGVAFEEMDHADEREEGANDGRFPGEIRDDPGPAVREVFKQTIVPIGEGMIGVVQPVADDFVQRRQVEDHEDRQRNGDRQTQVPGIKS
nr:hypothetical protein [Tanacetum cinerariifolium]